MKNRLLFIGDSFWGEEQGSPEWVSRELITQWPERALNFSILSSPAHTAKSLLQHAPRDIIGKQPGSICFCLGMDWAFRDPGAEYQDTFDLLIHEIFQNCQAGVAMVTIPAFLFQDQPVLRKHLDNFNKWLRYTLAAKYPLEILDFSAYARTFLKKQEDQPESEKVIRNLLNEKDRLNALGQTLLGHLILEWLVLKNEPNAQ